MNISSRTGWILSYKMDERTINNRTFIFLQNYRLERMKKAKTNNRSEDRSAEAKTDKLKAKMIG